jgi:Tfp pilus assembly protein PilP
LVGIIWDVKDPNAIVEDSAGLGYIVRVGTPIGANDGKVKLIKPGEIVVEETHVDIYGARKRREVSMQLHLEKAQ